ncbi:CPBP family intramembrane metalloprotease [Candidatus Curtissbacteria bacterium]|nr:CPBP family intramembrane metalloprotease [Candidatus Curtissbacteria bacterium]
MKRWFEPLLLFAAIALVWTFYRALTHLPSEVDELIAKPILWLGPVFAVDARQLHWFRSAFKTHLARNVLLGIITAIAFSTIRIFSTYFRFNAVNITPYDLSLFPLFRHSLVSLFTAGSEELVFRGYFQDKFLSHFKNLWPANFITTFLFVLIHIPVVVFTLKYSPSASIFYFAIVAMVSLVSGVLFYRTRNLVASIVFHAVWNLFSSLFR